MEQMYRRRTSTGYSERHGVLPARDTRKTIKKAGICLFIFLFALIAKLYPAGVLAPVEYGVRFILTENTDFKAEFAHLSEFFQKILKENRQQSSESEEILSHLQCPLSAEISSPFGVRSDPNTGEEGFHYGVDLAAPLDEKVKCAAGGEVIEAGSDAEYGKYVLVRHTERIYTMYAHLNTILPASGDRIEKGQVLGTVGETGNATGPHLHFEIRDENTFLDPQEFLDFK